MTIAEMTIGTIVLDLATVKIKNATAIIAKRNVIAIDEKTINGTNQTTGTTAVMKISHALSICNQEMNILTLKIQNITTNSRNKNKGLQKSNLCPT